MLKFLGRLNRVVCASMGILTVLAFTVHTSALAQVMSSGNFQVQLDNTAAGGEHTATSANFQVSDTVGESAAGDSASGSFGVNVAGFQQVTACSDGIDNDGDTLVDLADPGCDNEFDETETETSSTGGSTSSGTPTPKCTLDASPNPMPLNGEVTISWTSKNVGNGTNDFVISPNIGAVSEANGQQKPNPQPTGPTTYTGTVKRGSKTATCSVTVNIAGGDLLSFGQVNYQTTERDPGEDFEVEIEVVRRGSATGAVNIDVELDVYGGVSAATENVDFRLKNQNLSWPPGDTDSRFAVVEIIGDDIPEQIEHLSLRLANPIGDAQIDTPSVTTLGIADDDGGVTNPDTASLVLIKEVINSGGGTAAEGDFQLLLNGNPIAQRTTNQVAGGVTLTLTEQPVADYQFAHMAGTEHCPRTLGAPFVLPKGTVTQCTIYNEYVGDTLVNGSDSFVTFQGDQYRVDEGQGTFIVRLERTGNTDGAVEAVYKVVDGSASRGNDFSHQTQVIRWEDGQRGPKDLPFQVFDDDSQEGDEAFLLELVSLTGTDVFMGRFTTSQVIIEDNDIKEGDDDDDDTGSGTGNTTGSPGGLTAGDPGCTGIGCGIISPPPKTPTNIATTVGLVAGILSLLGALFGNPLALAEIVLAPFRASSLMMSFFGLRKKRRPWGTVYDSQTKQPLDPAYVTLLDAQDNEVASTITDIDGRYGFLVQPGRYRLTAGKTNYIFPSDILHGRRSDELYTDLYYGEIFEIKDEHDVIVKNVPMDAEKFDWNEFAKKDKKLMSFYSRHSVLFARVLEVIFWAGLVMSVAATFTTPTVFNVVIFILYIIMLVLRMFGIKPRNIGSVIDTATGQPLSFGILRFISPSTNFEVSHAVCDKYGRYYALVSPGEYIIRVQKKLPDGSYKQVYESKPIHTKKGILNVKIKV